MTADTAAARRYAKALAALAAEGSRLEPVAQELARFDQQLAASDELRAVVARPWIRASAKRAIVERLAERLELSPLVRRFLALVAQRRRLTQLPEILAAYRALVDEAAGRVRARVWSAAALTDAERAAIRRYLGRRVGKTVLLEAEVDPALLGGFVAEVGSRIVDASLRGQLRTLREQITRGSA